MSLNRRANERKPEQLEKKSDLFDGIVLFFISNSRKNEVWRFRMMLFAQYEGLYGMFGEIM